MKKGWDVVKLGDVCKTGSGGTPLKSHKDYYECGTIPWLLSGEVSQGSISEAKKFITEKGLKNSSAKIFPVDTVLVAMYGATAGQVGILKFKACTNQAVCGILPNNKTIPEYLYYCFLSKKDELISQAVGNAQPNISQIKIRNTPIPLPPLPEQKRIVAILDEAFSAIAKAKANAEQNLKNAKELFESYLQSVFENKGDDWENRVLSDIYDVRDGTHDSPKYISNGFPLITSKNLKNDLLNYDNVNYISEQDWININKRSKVNVGDILFAMIGTIGNPVVIESNPDFAIKNVALFKVPKNQNSYFLKYYLDTKSTIDKMMADAKGTTQKFVGLGYLRNFKIAVPPLNEQNVIANKLTFFSGETKKLESIYQQKIADLEELKKTILQKAFNGELNLDRVAV